MNLLTTLLYSIIFLYGIIIGSFLNVVIYRLPAKENLSQGSHCTACGYRLRWFDLVPLASYIFLKGSCRKCKSKISLQYPLIELSNGLLYIFIFYMNGFPITTVLYCIVATVLLAISIIDFRTYEIPIELNITLLLIGLIRLGLDYKNWSLYLIGFFVISMFLYIVYLITKGRGIGGGDIKLMAVCGLILGYKSIILAFIIGCVLASLIHSIRMIITKEDHVLAFGPYLSMGVFISMMFGERIIQWYRSLF